MQVRKEWKAGRHQFLNVAQFGGEAKTLSLPLSWPKDLVKEISVLNCTLFFQQVLTVLLVTIRANMYHMFPGAKNFNSFPHSTFKTA